MTQRKRTLALWLAVAMLFMLLSSVAFIGLHADHDCIGEGCEVCELLCVCAERLHRLASPVIMLALAMVAYSFFRGCAANATFFRTSCTLVALKVKLSN